LSTKSQKHEINKSFMYDLIIIGASAAGVSAAIYAARRNLNFIVLTKDIGGEVATSGEIENYLGYPHTDGFELTEKFKEQLEYYKVQVEEPYVVKAINNQQSTVNQFTVVAENSEGKEEVLEAKTVIVASGIRPRLLGVLGEERLRGKGVTYCTTCDGPLFKGKVTATIGGGNSALESALMMKDIATKVYVINKNPVFKGDVVLLEKLKQATNVEIIYTALTTEFVGDGFLKALKYKDQEGTEHTLEVEGAMVHIGNIPNSDIADVAKDQFKNIMVNERCETSVPGLFAAGDVTNVAYKQIVIAAGQGAIASLAAVEYLNRMQ
jgi:alkyl hydroperoxide reductase subunit AhpF